MTIITLSNGKKVGNFSSPHPFIFEDGSILPAVSAEEAERLKVDFIETPAEYPYPDRGTMKGDVLLAFDLSPAVLKEIDRWIRCRDNGGIDVVFVPLPMLEAMKKTFVLNAILRWPFRAIRIEDRIKKLVSIHKQCI